MEGGSIKPIGRSSVHRICSGQVVLTLATAIKELVENSLDAGATIIEVKLKEYGSESIEVIDNGKGVKACDFKGITLKHHTSKISDFSDVQSVSTFGFRGEALSSLCALSDVEIVTCHSDSAVGSLLIYDHDGVLVRCSSTPRQVGTTVTCKNLFYTLPVRHKEFHRNVRREYAKMVQMLTAYCLISIHKRITCTNTTDKGKKITVLSTNSSSTVKDNIACIFGSKQACDLMEFVQSVPTEEILEEYFLPQTTIDKCGIFCIKGFVSSCSHGDGRSSADRQFFFINGRPCDLPKVSKLINEIYHAFNKAQYPFVFLDVILADGGADVNVTPDKRQIFIPEEKLLLCIVKSSLHRMYHLQPSQMKISSASLFFQKNCPGTPPTELPRIEDKVSALPDVSGDSLKRKADINVEDNNLSSPPLKCLRKEELSEYGSSEACKIKDLANLQNTSDSKIKETVQSLPSSNEVALTVTLPYDEERAVGNALLLRDILQKAKRVGGSGGDRHKVVPRTIKINQFLSKIPPKNSEITQHQADNFPAEELAPKTTEINQLLSKIPPKNSETVQHQADNLPAEELVVDKPRQRRRKTRTVEFSMDAIRSCPRNTSVADEGLAYRKFRSKITPTESNTAEEELKREIKKENFSEMSIIGQFNLGFIVARLHNDLFIVDQHATDEKYNFEMLRKDTVLQTQVLISPQELELSAASESVLLDHLAVFEKSGFRFSVDEGGPVGRRVRLTSVPLSRSWSFGKEDVDEMIFMLTDNPVSVIRPSRVNQMFASRACRKSVMVGTALSMSCMKKLLVHMGEIEQPWNCPHGRPTIRHLFDLRLLWSTAEDDQRTGCILRMPS